MTNSEEDMDSEKLTLVIQCGFDEDDLIRQLDSANDIVGVADPDEFDHSESVKNFQSICKRVLTEKYGTDTFIDCQPSIPTRVYKSGKIDLLETEHVQEIRDRVITDLDWPVKQKELWLTVEEAAKQYRIPFGILHWLCVCGALDNVKSDEFGWSVSSFSCKRFYKNYFASDEEFSHWSIARNDSDLVGISGIETQFLGNLTIDTHQSHTLLVTPLNNSAVPALFRGNNGYASIQIGYRGISISIWQFAKDHDYSGPRSYNFAKFRQALIEEARSHDCMISHFSEQHPFLELRFDLAYLDESNWSQLVHLCMKRLEAISRDVELSLQGGPKLRPEHITKEGPFRDDVLDFLLKKLFREVHNNHGNREYGKDFTFTVVSNLGRQYGAVQAKAGNLDGKSGGKLDQILNQLDDAFSMPYRSTQTGDDRFISIFIIAISGKITPDGRDKLFHKLSKQRRLGAVLLWTGEDIEELIHHCWSDNYESIHKTNWNLKRGSGYLQ